MKPKWRHTRTLFIQLAEAVACNFRDHIESFRPYTNDELEVTVNGVTWSLLYESNPSNTISCYVVDGPEAVASKAFVLHVQENQGHLKTILSELTIQALSNPVHQPFFDVIDAELNGELYRLVAAARRRPTS